MKHELLENVLSKTAGSRRANVLEINYHALATHHVQDVCVPMRCIVLLADLFIEVQLAYLIASRSCKCALIGLCGDFAETIPEWEWIRDNTIQTGNKLPCDLHTQALEAISLLQSSGYRHLYEARIALKEGKIQCINLKRSPASKNYATR